MAHGFITISNKAIFNYKCDNNYYPDKERGIFITILTCLLTGKITGHGKW